MLNDKLILITGGNSGIGYAVAQKLVSDRVTVITTSRNNRFNDRDLIPNTINRQYLDVTNKESVDKLFLWISQQSQKLSVLINNAGIGIFKPFSKITADEWNTVIATNLTGSFLCSKSAFSLMQQTGGRIINIGSIVELAGIEDNSAYAASKSGLRGLSFVISQEGRKINVTATHITLGAVYSDIWNNRAEFSKDDMLDIEHVAESIKYIANLPNNIRIDNFEITPLKKIL